MLKNIFLFLSLFLFFGPAHAQFRVGNGGEGILVNNEILVRDLVEYQVTPVFSDLPSDYFEKKLAEKNPLSLTANQIALLANKMAVANNAHRYWGFQLLAVFKAYEWSFSPRALALMPESFSRIHFSDEERVQLANRYLRSILISKPSFDKMSDEQKVTLILHEVIYSMANLERLPLNENVMFQNLASVRMVVAQLMSSADGSHFSKYVDVGKLLAIPAQVTDTSCTDLSSVRLEMTSGKVVSLPLPRTSGRKEIQSLVEQVCKKTENFNPALIESVWLVSHFTPVAMNIITYPSLLGTDVAVAFGSYEPVSRKLLSPPRAENCVNGFLKILSMSPRRDMVSVEGICPQ